jgi:hypothetical protein
MIKSTPLRISSPVSETLAFNPETSRITSPFCALVVVIATLLPTPRLSPRREEDKEDKEEEDKEEDRRLKGSRFEVDAIIIVVVCAPLLSRKSEEEEETALLVKTTEEAVVMSVFIVCVSVSVSVSELLLYYPSLL